MMKCLSVCVCHIFSYFVGKIIFEGGRIILEGGKIILVGGLLYGLVMMMTTVITTKMVIIMMMSRSFIEVHGRPSSVSFIPAEATSPYEVNLR